METSINELIKKINDFRDERNWRPFHNEKDLAISISLEANELLEIFQWRSAEEAVKEDLEHLKEEIADVLIYTFMMADNLQLNIPEIILSKIYKNSLKYPVNQTENFKNE